MTIIAASSTERLMIADTQVTTSDHYRLCTVSKIVLGVDGAVGGGCGEMSQIAEFLDWVRGGRKGELPGRVWKDAEGLVMLPDGTILDYEGPVPFQILDPVVAIGTGSAVFTAAIRAGASLRRAAEITCELVNTCGGTIMELSPVAPSPTRRRRTA